MNIEKILSEHKKWLMDEGGRRADMYSADLKCKDLSYADLSYANLRFADLRGAKLSCANLSGANMSCANLSGSDLSYADLRGANLRGANLSDVTINEKTTGVNISYPEEGSFIAYKKADCCVVKLQITEDAKRSSATTLKCRASKALVLGIEHIETGEKRDCVRSNYDQNFIYEVGKVVEVKDFDEDRWNECSTGIHFFISKELAKQY